MTLTVIQLRRWKFGGELGGPVDAKAYSSFLRGIRVTSFFFTFLVRIYEDLGKSRRNNEVGDPLALLHRPLCSFLGSRRCERRAEVWKFENMEAPLTQDLMILGLCVPLVPCFQRCFQLYI